MSLLKRGQFGWKNVQETFDGDGAPAGVGLDKSKINPEHSSSVRFERELK